ncbi:RHS repeat-associated core domain-containing protein [Pseudomonas sp. NFACC23-1]|uniref:RHS repeat-associated core domain-containing protein n=1 Tax=unclassified Pseudomonas TaxID=196821 RepID=UPI00087F3B15|nr:MULTISPECIES: RHS repeat-associated core domain-containing protein [unclassified Pseudomonas]SDB14505.1 RHS repeat-associated core domain-containing protein [Pseudomonas sp. NFACC17-2]SEJ12038.1 RHS repeat-associated core domain-containing protein [Pseudomonas sp. NFACC23-1]SFW47911.1 RHS repeat-associated core domain-containing protein [Pseudomonas sp. NFACC16-2]
MSAPSMKILCRYQYDPLDRLVGLKPLESPGTQRFYQEDELVNEIEGESQLTIMRHGPQPLAQRSGTYDAAETTLLATDQQRSLLRTVADALSQQMVYTAYGYRPGESGLSCLLGFNGERLDSITGHYLLGQGNRAFNPVLMRFNSPDELSPFDEGGINAYAYCGNDPINQYDPSGNYKVWNIPISYPNRYSTFTIQSTIISRPTASRPILIGRVNPTRNLLANTRSTSATPAANPITNATHRGFRVLPREGEPKGFSSHHTGQQPPQQKSTLNHARKRHAAGHFYDEVVGGWIEKHPNRRISIDTTKFDAATANLEALRAKRAEPELISQEAARVQRLRLDLKIISLRKMGFKTGITLRKKRGGETEKIRRQ